MKEGQQRDKSVLVLCLDVDNIKHLTTVCAHVAVGECNALGQTRCAARVLQHDGVAQRVGNGGRIALCAFKKAFPLMHVFAVVGYGFLGAAALFEAVEPVEREGKRIRSARDDKVLEGQAVAQGRNTRPEQVEQHHVLCARILHVGHDFFFHIQGVGHDYHAPGLDDAPECHHSLRHVGHHEGHAVARFYANAAQATGKAFCLFAQLLVGDARILKYNGQTVGIFICGLVQQGIQRLVPHLRGAWNEGVVMRKPGSAEFGVHVLPCVVDTLWQGEAEQISAPARSQLRMP